MVKTDPEEVNLVDLSLGLFVALRKNLLLLVLLPLLGIALVITLTSIKKRKFESNFILETSLLSQNECLVLVRQFEKVKLIPGLTKQQQKLVRDLETEVVSGIGTEEKTPLDETAVYVSFKAEVTDTTIFPVLQKALFDFINTSPALTKHRIDRDRFYQEMILKIDQEINGLEEVKKGINTKAQATYLNPSDLYYHTVSLFKEKTQYQIKREEIKNLHIIKEFKPILELQPNYIISAVVGLLLGFAVLFMVLFFKFVRRKMPTYQTAM